MKINHDNMDFSKSFLRPKSSDLNVGDMNLNSMILSSDDIDAKIYSSYMSKEQIDMVTQKTMALYDEIGETIAKNLEVKKNLEFWNKAMDCPHIDEDNWDCPVKQHIKESGVVDQSNCGLDCKANIRIC